MRRAVFILKEELNHLQKFNELQEKERLILFEDKDPTELLAIQQKKGEELLLIEDIEDRRKRIFKELGVKTISDFNEEMKALLYEILKEWRRLQIIREYNLSLLRDKINFNYMYLEAIREELQGKFKERAVSFDQTA